MKTSTSAAIRLFVMSATLVLPCRPALAASRASQSGALALGARVHAEHSTFTQLPFGDGDLSYLLALEYHDDQGYWQLGVDFAPDVTGSADGYTNALSGATAEVDYVATPQLNVVFKDGMWRGGLGIMTSFLTFADDATDKNGKVVQDDWTDLYWQFILGISVPLGRFVLEVDAMYVFEDWDELSEFDGADIDYRGQISISF